MPTLSLRDGLSRFICVAASVGWLVSGAVGSCGAAAASNGVVEVGGGPVVDPTSKLDPRFWVGSWIWAAETRDKQTCRFWRSFSIPEGRVVAKALVRITADNGYRLFLDGRELGRGSDWKSLTEYDLTWILFPGKHVFAVEAFNDRLQGGLLFGLRAELVSGAVFELGTDESWRVVPDGEPGWEARRQAPASWPAATVAGKFLNAPWETPPLAVTPVPPLLPVKVRFWQSGWFQVLLISICAAVGAFCLRLMATLALQRRAHEMLHRERERIARDIHDDLGAGMTQLVLMGEIAQQGMHDAPTERRQVDQICEKARDLLGAMDEVVWAVNPRRDTLRDFSVYVCQYAIKYLETTGIRCRLDVEPQLPALAFDLPIRRSLLMAVKEALNNAAKYSEASELFVRIHRRGETIMVVVEDDGRGFDPAGLDGSRNGLSNMTDRLTEAGGRCVVESSPGKGCRVELSVPLADPKSRRPWWSRNRAP